MKNSLLVGLLLLLSVPLHGEERPLVAVLHPLLAEAVQRIAGDHVRVETLMPPSADPHTFDPSPGDMARIQGAVLVVALGKNLETYLDRLRENLPKEVSIYEAGRPVPSLVIDVKHEAFICCPDHSHGAVDPHWWQSPVAMQRAVRHLGRELEKEFPAHKDSIRENTRLYMAELEELNTWAKGELSAIPKAQRKLVTPHASFGYFCELYGFQSIPVQGLSTEDNPTPAYLAETIETLRREQVRAVFPDQSANNTILHSLREATGVTLAPALIADNLGNADIDYRAMIRHNVNSIVKALSPVENKTTP
jgi:zinc/manganese transport system substrate-binding protein